MVVLIGFGFGFGFGRWSVRERNSDSDEESLLPAVELDSDELEVETVKSRRVLIFLLSIQFSIIEARRNWRVWWSSVLAAEMLCFVLVVVFCV